MRASGIDAVHVRERDLHRAADSRIVALATGEGRVVISADTDFGDLLAASGDDRPSVVLWRARERHTAAQAEVLGHVLREYQQELQRGAIVVIDDDRVRVRPLPIVR